MSKAFVRAESGGQFGSFATLLPKVEEPKNEIKLMRGRTAETLQKLRELAMAEGREDGYLEGMAEGQKEAYETTVRANQASVNAFREALDAEAARLEQGMAAWYAHAEEALAALAIEVATRILGRELTQNKDSVTDLAREALQNVSAVDKVRFRIHPLDSEILAKKKEMLLAANPTVRGIEIVDDPSIDGGVKIESDAGLIDATLRTQLELAFEALRRPV